MPKKDVEMVIKLTDEEKKHLEVLKGDIEKGEKAISAMKEMGLDVKALEERLNWAKTARDVLLREFI
ncbi:hypothetical protein ES703_08496 [subsurface metagenome]